MSDQARGCDRLAIGWLLAAVALIAGFAGVADCVPHIHPVQASAIAGDCADADGLCVAVDAVSTLAHGVSLPMAEPALLSFSTRPAARVQVLQYTTGPILGGNRQAQTCRWLL